MSVGSCSGPTCSGVRRRPPPPPEPALTLTAELSELSLDQGYHTLADCGPPRRRRDHALSDAIWLRILSYLEVSGLPTQEIPPRDTVSDPKDPMMLAAFLLHYQGNPMRQIRPGTVSYE